MGAQETSANTTTPPAPISVRCSAWLDAIVCGDCLEEMPKMPAQSVDAIISDLPYGTTACKWDSVIPFAPLWSEWKRLLKPNGAIVLTATEPFASLLRTSNLAQYKYDWVWDKHIPRGMHIAKYRPMQKHEMVLVFGDAPLKYNPIHTKRDKPVRVKNYGNSKASPLANNDRKERIYDTKGPDSILVGMWEANAGKLHSTQKPVSLMRYLVRTYTNPGDVVLDPCCGSGTTCIAAMQEGRHYIGIEKETNYAEITKQRIYEARGLGV
jgi:site-specific DNA-methyltransferase (adenine-specific)